VVFVACNGNDNNEVTPSEPEYEATLENERNEPAVEFNPQILEDFLAERVSLFDFGFRDWERDRLIAHEFALHDLDWSGTMDVLIRYAGEIDGLYVLYCFVDGEFRGLTLGEWVELLRDENDNIYVVQFERGDWVDIFRLNDFDLEPVFSGLFDEYETWIADSQLTPVARFVGHEEYLAGIIRQRLGLDDEPVSQIHADGPWFEDWRDVFYSFLRSYIGRSIAGGEEDFYFTLHDIDGDGIPELFVFMDYGGYVFYRQVYRFEDGWARGLPASYGLPRGFGGGIGTGSSIIFWEGNPKAFVFDAVGSGGQLTPIIVTDEGLDFGYFGFYGLNDEGFARYEAEGNMDWLNWEYHDLWIGGEPAIVEEFEAAFGAWGENQHLTLHPVTEENIQYTLFGN